MLPILRNPPSTLAITTLPTNSRLGWLALQQKGLLGNFWNTNAMTVLHRTTLIADLEKNVTISRYEPGELHPPHRDQHSRISIVLSGSLCEYGQDGAINMQPGDILIKSYRALHEDRFGQNGAVVAAIEFTDDDPLDARVDPELLHRRSDGFAFQHAAAMLEAAYVGDMQAVSAAGCDLITACLDSHGRRRIPPPWLLRLREEIEENGLALTDVATRARDAGVHPVHASRLFRQCFGKSITEHSRTYSIRRAIPLISRCDLSLSHAALLSGFYDQSHMNRAFRRVLGRTPQAIRSLLNATTG